jgi:hypothetical protein
MGKQLAPFTRLLKKQQKEAEKFKQAMIDISCEAHDIYPTKALTEDEFEFLQANLLATDQITRYIKGESK